MREFGSLEYELIRKPALECCVLVEVVLVAAEAELETGGDVLREVVDVEDV